MKEIKIAEISNFNLGRRIGKKVNGQIVQKFIYEGQLTPVAELDANNQIQTFYIYATKINVPDYIIKGGERYKIITDHLGSVRYVVRVSDGAVLEEIEYDSFGNVLYDLNPGFVPFGFAGGIYDPDTKLVRFGARDYDPKLGRWTSKDPTLFYGGDSNLYGYVLNDPINLFDVNGFSSVSFGVMAGVGFIVTIGKNPDGDTFVSLKVGIGSAAFFSYDPKGTSPKWQEDPTKKKRGRNDNSSYCNSGKQPYISLENVPIWIPKTGAELFYQAGASFGPFSTSASGGTGYNSYNLEGYSRGPEFNEIFTSNSKWQIGWSASAGVQLYVW